MDLSLNDEQGMLQDMIRKLCQEYASLAQLRAIEGTEPGYSIPFWEQLSHLGLTGLGIPECYGGQALGLMEEALVFEEFGRSLAVSPYHVSSVLAAYIINSIGSTEQKDTWLSAIAGGEKIVTVAQLEPESSFSKNALLTQASFNGDQCRISGTKILVPFAASADAVIVFAGLEGSEDKVVAVLLELQALREKQDAGIEISYSTNLGKEPLYKMVFSDVTVSVGKVLNKGACSWQYLEEAMCSALISSAAFAVGGASAVHEISVEYAKYRYAFGRPIGGFQAIAHYLADVTVAIEGCRTLVYQAAWAKDQGKAWQHLAAMAKLQACETFCHAAAVAIQVHGGMGYTIEADPQLFFRRAKQLQLLNWGPDILKDRIADQVFA